MIKFNHKGDFKNTEKFMKNALDRKYLDHVDEFAQQGVKALAAATPIDSGKTAECWTYSVEEIDGKTTLSWENSNVNEEVNIALLLQNGHGTGTGGYVPGRDYINPAIQPIMDELVEEGWKEVTGD